METREFSWRTDATGASSDVQAVSGRLILRRLRAELRRRGLGPERVADPPPRHPDDPSLAGVLILLYPHRAAPSEAEIPHLVLTQRPATMRSHSGQISLPGGRYETADGTLLRTALRETHEELGIDPTGLTVWGRLEPEFVVVSHYLIAPFIAYAPHRPEFRPAVGEVDHIIELPLPLLLDPDTLAEEIWELRGMERQVSFYRHGEYKIWGATARVLGQLVALLTPESAAHAAERLAPGAVIPEGDRIDP